MQISGACTETPRLSLFVEPIQIPTLRTLTPYYYCSVTVSRRRAEVDGGPFSWEDTEGQIDFSPAEITRNNYIVTNPVNPLCVLTYSSSCDGGHADQSLLEEKGSPPIHSRKYLIKNRILLLVLNCNIGRLYSGIQHLLSVIGSSSVKAQAALPLIEIPIS